MFNLLKGELRTFAITGSTGSGKSTFHHEVTKYFMDKSTPKGVSFVFFDLKMIEFGRYADSKYLHKPIITDTEHGILALAELAGESTRRLKNKNKTHPLLVIHIEECDLIMAYPDLFVDSWITIAKHALDTNMYMIYSSSRCGEETFPKELLEYTNVRGVFCPNVQHSIDKKYDSRIFGEHVRFMFGDLKIDIPAEPYKRVFRTKDGQMHIYDKEGNTEPNKTHE